MAVLTSASAILAMFSVVFATIIPIIGIVYFARTEQIDYDIPERGARARPFAIAIASYLLGFTLLTSVKAPTLLSGLMLAYCINTSVMFLVTLFWKISIHAAGVTGPLGFLVFRLGPVWSLLYLLVIPVGVIRLSLGQHTLLQVIAGALLSGVLTWIQIIFLLPHLP